jgi:hypothetical protein
MNDILKSIERLVAEADSIDKQIEALTASRANIIGKLDAVRAALGMAEDPPAPPQPPKATDSGSTWARVHAWVQQRTDDFSAADVRAAFKDESGSYLAWIVNDLNRRREIVRVERGRYKRADLVKARPKIVDVAPATAPVRTPGTISNPKILRVLDWCKTQPGEFSWSDARNAIPEVNGSYIGFALGELRKKCFLTRVPGNRYVYGRVAESLPVVAEAAE